MQKITPTELTVLAKYIHEISGIVLDQSKDYLIESRLGPLLQREEFPNYSVLKNVASSDKSGRLAALIIDAITTNETSFFRDKHPFELLVHKLIPDCIKRQMEQGEAIKPAINIWCAASSTGQEVYSVAMAIKESLGNLNNYRINIFGTDISKAVLSVASDGRYSKIEISRGISDERLKRHFSPDGQRWRISEELRSIIQFRQLNLLQPSSAFNKFDIIFCRYVAIYFSRENRKLLFNKLADQLKNNGVLLIGGTESIIGLTNRFSQKRIRNTTYYELNMDAQERAKQNGQ
jgi:chemotaxis protein methyltransferase CheR